MCLKSEGWGMEADMQWGNEAMGTGYVAMNVR